MDASFEVSKTAVRRFLLDVQGLLPVPASDMISSDRVLDVIRTLECVQIDPVAAVERNQHLVLATRSPNYTPAALEQLLLRGQVFEYMANAACVIPMEDYPMFEAVRRRFQSRLQGELEELGPVVQGVLDRFEAEGPLPSRAFKAVERVHGYWDNDHPKTKATSHALNLLHDVGRIHVVRREGNVRFFDICERAVPRDLRNQAEVMDMTEASAALVDKYVRAYRVFDIADARFGWQPMTAAQRRDTVMRRVQEGSVVPLQMEGIRRPYFILASDIDKLREHVRGERDECSTEPVCFLPPLDNLLWRRDRVMDLFDFTYTWEVYQPLAKRRYGYYALPILAGDRLIGRIDPQLDRASGRLNIRLLQIEPSVRWSKPLRKHVQRALESFARFHQAKEIHVERTEPAGLTL